MPSNLKTGAAYAVLAYFSWGLFPAYWKLLQGTAYEEILAHRIFWSAIFFSTLLIWKKRKTAIHELKLATRHIKGLALSAVLISLNWFFYIYAVNSGQVLESSLGYFINPLVNVLLGRIFLGERLAPLQKVSVGLAALGVLQLTLQGDHIPIIALALAFLFGFYGLIRKKIPVQPLTASTLESLLLAIPAFIFIVHRQRVPEAVPYTLNQWVFLILAGMVTPLPLLWFAEAAKRLKLSTLGFFQYIAPSLQFTLAVFCYGEQFTHIHARSFACIWGGLALYSYHLARTAKRRRRS